MKLADGEEFQALKFFYVPNHLRVFCGKCDGYFSVRYRGLAGHFPSLWIKIDE